MCIYGVNSQAWIELYCGILCINIAAEQHLYNPQTHIEECLPPTNLRAEKFQRTAKSNRYFYRNMQQ